MPHMIPDDRIHADGTLVLYSRIDRLRELDQRSAASGDSAHHAAAADHAAEAGGKGPSPTEDNQGAAGSSQKKDR